MQRQRKSINLARASHWAWTNPFHFLWLAGLFLSLPFIQWNLFLFFAVPTIIIEALNILEKQSEEDEDLTSFGKFSLSLVIIGFIGSIMFYAIGSENASIETLNTIHKNIMYSILALFFGVFFFAGKTYQTGKTFYGTISDKLEKSAKDWDRRNHSD
jgi:Na+/proline symporter